MNVAVLCLAMMIWCIIIEYDDFVYKRRDQGAVMFWFTGGMFGLVSIPILRY